MPPLSSTLQIYLHLPFCRQKCGYCDFYSLPLSKTPWLEQYTTALQQEIDHCAPFFRQHYVESLYFGGGTPSLLPLQLLEQLLDALAASFSLLSDVEITLEANPNTLSLPYLQGLRSLGLNRLSLGLQSLSDQHLRALGRCHDSRQARRCYEQARQAGFENINVDLIYGRPEQTPSSWRKELSQLLAWQPEHLSLYELSLEEETPLGVALQQGRLSLPDAEVTLQMFRLCREETARAGWNWYEISNYARAHKTSQHNLAIWQGSDYLGLGAAAHSFRAAPPQTRQHSQDKTEREAPDFGQRRAQPPDLQAYLRQPQQAPWRSRSRQEALVEALLSGLRLRQGLSLEPLRQQWGIDLHRELQHRLPPLIDAGYLNASPQRWLLTPRGAELLDSVLAFLLHDQRGTLPDKA